MGSTANILSIEQLNRLSRKPYSSHPGSDEIDAVEGLQQLWQRLLQTVHSSAVSDKHMTAACNAICYTIRARALGSNEASRKFVRSTTTWYQTFEAARCAFAAGKNKPALQVLDTLAYMTGEISDRYDAIQVVENTVREMAKIIYTQEPKKSLKEACIVLYFFLRKLSDFMSATSVFESALRSSQSAFARICASNNVRLDKKTQDKSEPWFSFVVSLLMVTAVAESKSATLKLLSLLCTDKFVVEKVDMVSTTTRAVDSYSAANEHALEDVIREVLPAVLTDSKKYHTFLTKQLNSSESKMFTLEIVLGVLNFGKLCNYVTEDELPRLVNGIVTSPAESNSTTETFAGFETLLSHTLPSIRLRALHLLVGSKSTSAEIRPGIFRCLIKVLPCLHDDTDAFHRGELFSVFRRFLTRIQQSYRLRSKDQVKDGADDTLGEYTTFCHQLCNFLKSESLVHISYSRHILALDLLNFITGQVWPFEAFAGVPVSDKDFLATLFRLVLDPYDDIRGVSANILLNIANVRSVDFNVALDVNKPLISTSLLAAATNRADHADALGRLIGILYKTSMSSNRTHSKAEGTFRDLQAQIATLSTYVQDLDSFDVATTYPLHGRILGVRYLLGGTITDMSVTMLALKAPLLVVCQKIWTLSQPHLCVDSPEVEVDTSEEPVGSGPKDQLAYAWRALRDSSLLMQAMLDTSMTDHATFSSIGRMCFDQLALLRHRGAFSAVAQTFTLCCQKCRSSEDLNTRSLVLEWFSLALAELQKQADKLTRRSAGLPAIFTALLDPQDDQRFMACIQELVRISIQPAPDTRSIETENKLRLPQVHALNCLKDFMTTSRFRTKTEMLVMPMVDLAAQCMQSHIWAIKNCGLMLLRASINRLDPDTGVGNSEAGVNTRTISDVGRRPIEVALSLLPGEPRELGSAGETVQIGSQGEKPGDIGNEAIFAGLDLIGRLFIRKHERASIRSVVMHQLGNSLWHVRAQAARLLVTMTAQDEEIAVAEQMLCGPESSTGLNEFHGRMLVARGLLTRLQEGSMSGAIQETFAQNLITASRSNKMASSKTLVAMWLETASQLLHSTYISPTIPARLYVSISDQLNTWSEDGNQPTTLYERALARFMLQVHVFTGTPDHHKVIHCINKSNDTIDHVFNHQEVVQNSDQSQRYLNIVTSLLRSTEAGGARSSVLKAGATYLGGYLNLSDSLHLPVLVDVLMFEQPLPRDVMVAQLAMYTALCRTVWQQDAMTLTKLRRLSTGFRRHLRFATNDGIEERTRRAAVEALQKWQDLAALDDMVDAIFGIHGRVEILSVLYDLLNDDDDEIRGKAAEVAAAFHQYSHDSIRSGPAIVLCALASRQQLRSHGLRAFRESEMLSLECVRRILGIMPWRSSKHLKMDIIRYIQRNSIGRQIKELICASNDLFAEEKQNLYVDEVAELKAWAQVLVDLECGMSCDLVKTLSEWADDGLCSAQNFLQQEDGELDQTTQNVVEKQANDATSMRKLNVDFTPELEILLIRTITITNILTRRTMLQRHEEDEITNRLSLSLQKLCKKCENMSVPALLREAFTWFT